jgi:putative ABC transport system permease protein
VRTWLAGAGLAAALAVLPSLLAAAPVADLLLTDRTARALGVAAGDTVEIAASAGMEGARLFRVAGVYRPGPDPFEVGYGRLNVKMHLPDLARILDAGDGVDRFVVRARDPAAAPQVAAAIENTAAGLRAYTAADLAQRGATTFAVISQFHLAIGIVSLLAGLVFLVAIMVLKVEEMRRELGALRLLGVSQRTIVRSVIALSSLVALLGSALGTGLGFLAIAIINPLAQAHYDTDLVFARATPAVVLLAVGLSAVLGVLAGIAVAARIASGRPLEQVGR